MEHIEGKGNRLNGVHADPFGGRLLCDIDWIKRKTRPGPPRTKKQPLAIADLFNGCGGMTLGVIEGARAAGRRVEIKLAVDSWKPAVDVYRDNFGVDETVARLADIVDLLPGKLGRPPTRVEADLKREIGRVDVVMAGPPCQGHSDLNNSTRRKDDRNKLYLRVVRFAEITEPDLILIENVPAVIHDADNVVGQAVRQLRRLDYFITDKVVNLNCFGIPQSRKRHILLASRRGVFDFPKISLPPEREKIPISKFIDDIIDEPQHSVGIFGTPSRMTAINKERIKYLFDRDEYDLPDQLRPECHRTKKHSYRSMYGRLR